jgi:hypothetical protein
MNAFCFSIDREWRNEIQEKTNSKPKKQKLEKTYLDAVLRFFAPPFRLDFAFGFAVAEPPVRCLFASSACPVWI